MEISPVKSRVALIRFSSETLIYSTFEQGQSHQAIQNKIQSIVQDRRGTNIGGYANGSCKFKSLH